jgi:hypothetical protein
MPEQPYSKALVRQQEKERSKSRGENDFALGMKHGQRSDYHSSVFQSLDLMSVGSGPLDIDVSKNRMFRKESVGRQFQKKQKVVVPNCALIIP